METVGVKLLSIKNMNPKTDYAYCAGLVDGEGCIQIVKCESFRNRNKSPQYMLQIQVNMTSIDCIKKIQGVFGGNIASRDREGTNFQSYNWRIFSNNCMNMLKKMLPYLKEKKEQAIEAINFQNMLNRRVKEEIHLGQNRNSLTEEELNKREYYFNLLKKLKRSKLTPISTNRD